MCVQHTVLFELHWRLRQETARVLIFKLSVNVCFLKCLLSDGRWDIRLSRIVTAHRRHIKCMLVSVKAGVEMAGVECGALERTGFFGLREVGCLGNRRRPGQDQTCLSVSLSCPR